MGNAVPNAVVFSIEENELSVVHSEAVVQAATLALDSHIVVLQQSCESLQLVDPTDSDAGSADDEVDDDSQLITADALAASGVHVIVGEPFYFKTQNLQTWSFVNFWLKANAVARKCF